MLTRFHKILLGLLGVQLVLAVVMLARGGDAALVKDAPMLPGFDAAKVTRVRVFSAGADKPTIDAVKKGEAWALASHFDFPGDPEKLKNALSPLGKLVAAEPMATSASRHKQLRVGDRDFERKVILDIAGAGEQTLYFGSPAGGRRTAVRIKGNDVFAAAGASAPSADPSAYVKTKYVDVIRPDVAKVTVQRDGKTFELERVVADAAPAAGAGSAAGSGAGSAAGSGAGSAGAAAGSGAGSAAAPPAVPWKATIDGAPIALATGESLDTDAIERLIGQAAQIELRAPGDPKRDASKPAARVTLHKKGAEPPIVLDVVTDGDTSYWVHQQGNERAIVVDKISLTDLVLVDRDKLVKKPAPPGAPGAAGGEPMPGLPPGLPPGMMPMPME